MVLADMEMDMATAMAMATAMGVNMEAVITSKRKWVSGPYSGRCLKGNKCPPQKKLHLSYLNVAEGQRSSA